MRDSLGLRKALEINPNDLPELRLLTLVDRFGDWAPWVLAEPVLQRVERIFGALGRAKLQVLEQPGACAPLFVTDGSVPCLRRRFALPLRWEPNLDHVNPSTCLPVGEKVARALGIEGWVLRPLGRVDPEVIELLCSEELTSWESAWVALAIGLLSAEGRWTTRAGVLATGAWSREAGISPVAYVDEKVRLALELGASKLLLPSVNYDDADRVLRMSPGARLELVRLRHGYTNFREVVSPVFAGLPLPPRENCSDREQIDYVRALIENGQVGRALEYYREAVMPRVVSRLQKQWRDQTGVATAGTLVTIASRSPETACYSIAACRPKRVLVLHDQTMEQYARDIEEHVGALLPPSEQPHIQREPTKDREDLLEKIRSLPRDQLAGTDGRLVLDLTPGTKEMTLELVLSVARPGDLGVYIVHKLERPHGISFVVPHSERIRVWKL